MNTITVYPYQDRVFKAVQDHAVDIAYVYTADSTIIWMSTIQKYEHEFLPKFNSNGEALMNTLDTSNYKSGKLKPKPIKDYAASYTLIPSEALNIIRKSISQPERHQTYSKVTRVLNDAPYRGYYRAISLDDKHSAIFVIEYGSNQILAVFGMISETFYVNLIVSLEEMRYFFKTLSDLYELARVHLNNHFKITYGQGHVKTEIIFTRQKATNLSSAGFNTISDLKNYLIKPIKISDSYSGLLVKEKSDQNAYLYDNASSLNSCYQTKLTPSSCEFLKSCNNIRHFYHIKYLNDNYVIIISETATECLKLTAQFNNISINDLLMRIYNIDLIENKPENNARIYFSVPTSTI